MEGGILPSRQELLSRIELVCDLDSSFVALTGESGSGKSALLEYFVEQHCTQHKKCFVQANKDENGVPVKEQILLQLFHDQTVDSRQSLTQSLSAVQFEEFQRFIIIIDNAENIDTLLLNELLGLLNAPIDNLQVSVIIAQVSDQERFSFINSNHPLIEIHIESLNNAESRMLLEYHYSQMMDSDRAEVQRFIERCDGNPGRLLKWQDSEGGKSRKKSGIPNIALIVAAFVLIGVAVGASWYFTSTTKDSSELAIEQLRAKVEESNTDVASESNDKVEENADNAVDDGTAVQNGEQAAQNGEQAEYIDLEAAEKAANPESTGSVTEELLAQKWDPEGQKPYVDQAIKDAAAAQALEDAEDKARALAKQQNEENSAQVQTVEATQAGDVVDESSVNDNEVAQLPESNAVSKDTAPADEQTDKQVSQIEQPVEKTKETLLDKMDNSWFMAQNAASVVLQLTGVSNQGTLQSYLNYHKLGDKAHIYQSLRNGKPWYVVTYGVFDSLDAANNAKSELPATLKNGQPWAKSIRTIQTELLNADKKIQ